MAIFEFKLPDLGEGVVEGEIVKWLVKEGEPLAEDQGVVELMTDKATVVVPSPKKGKVLKLHGAEGQMAKVHTPLVTLEVEGAGAATAAPAPSHATAAAAAAAVVAAPAAKPKSDAKVLATPVTRRMAREHGLDLGAIAGSGPQGRVTKADVLSALSGNGATAKGPQLSAQTAKSWAPMAAQVGDQRIPLRGLRKRIAAKMVESKFTAPHFTFVEEVDCTAMVALRARINAQLKAAGDPSKLSFLPIIAKACVAALRKFPTLNANFDEAAQELVVKGSFNIGVAVATEDGLIVPVVKAVEHKSLRQIGDEVEQLAKAVREKRAKNDDLTGGTFTISSLGQTGGLMATPIINHPEVAILGVHRMRERPVVRDGKIEIGQVMNLSLSFDHRVIDGAIGADFTYALIKYLENPELMLLEMT
ncbi:MAG: 2-oxo acid dehydrogenase subunit E2 [Deltaproteobacteria bacterium]|nr:2-oxo acid dehydrogenase subunit E2 [Deltaproteobacteria bacterium]